MWAPSHGRAKAGRPAWTYIQQLCVDMGCSQATCRRQWTIGRGSERGSGISVLIARHEDDDMSSSNLSHFRFICFHTVTMVLKNVFIFDYFNLFTHRYIISSVLFFNTNNLHTIIWSLILQSQTNILHRNLF